MNEAFVVSLPCTSEAILAVLMRAILLYMKSRQNSFVIKLWVHYQERST